MSAATFVALPAQGDPDEPPGWQASALCAQTDPEAFFPEKGGSAREAKSICVGCPVKAECLTYALEGGEHFGIWGGLTERERRRLTHNAIDTAVPQMADTVVWLPAPNLEPEPEPQDLVDVPEDEEPEMSPAALALFVTLRDQGYSEAYALKRAANL